uniref:PLAT domain-containing protein n=1 Tax=Mesocestoides corti TaxID=53468 RepID=A0A5K3FHB8_MESCO
MRNGGIIMLCTSPEQTLVARRLDAANGNSEGTLVAWATGPRKSEAYWRVHRRAGQVRAFESVAHPGRFLRITQPGECDVMGVGEEDCSFRVHRVRSRGLVRLESVVHPGLMLYILANGFVTAASSLTGKNTVFYPMIVEFGTRKTTTQTSTPHSLDADEPTTAPDTPTSVNGSRRSEDSKDDEASETSGPRKSPLRRGGTINKKLDKESDWKVKLHTSESAYNSLVVLVVYGARGDSGPIILGSSDGENALFRAGNIDEFKINLADIGPLFKIRLEVSPVNESKLPYWGLYLVIFENMVTHASVMFDFTNRPFMRTYSNCQLSREQVVCGKEPDQQVRARLPLEVLSPDELDPSVGLVVYSVKLRLALSDETVTPSDIRGFYSGPKISLLGHYGGTGRRTVGLNNSEPSEGNGDLKVYVCRLEAVYLGPLERCTIGPVAEPGGHGNLCESIDVLDPLTNSQYRFPAHVWIGTEWGCGAREVSLQPEGSRSVQ